MICTVCNNLEDVRPYGKNGAFICFDCMTATPEAEMEAHKQYTSQFEAAAAVGNVVLIGEETGPRPLTMGNI